MLEILIQCQLKSIKLELTCTDLVPVLDQAIYAKALQIILDPRYKYLADYVNVRGFHIILNFYSVFKKRFSDAGLRDLIIEADLVGKIPPNCSKQPRLY